MVKRPFLSARQKIYLPFKRFFDILSSLLAIVVFSPLYIVLAILVKCTSKGPIFFKQKRIGKYKKTFNILKFRTMRIDAPQDVATHLLDNPDKYITKVGRFLRKTSLDEIPQAFNIFVGQMSVVGPRPALWNQDDLVLERDKYHANEIVPGLSGWAQCNGRDTLPISEKAKLDGEYVKRFNIWFDIRIIFKTVFQAFRGKDEVEGKKDSYFGNDSKTKELKVITFGVFDFVHVGHINLFSNCKKYGNYLIVAIQEDDYVSINKPLTKLSLCFSERFKLISNLDSVDKVISYKQIDETIVNVDFDVLAVGPDQTNVHFIRAIEWCKKNNKKVVIIERTPGISSTQLRG